MTPETIADYRANYDREAWERITQGWRLHVVPAGAVLAINALCDEVERLREDVAQLNSIIDTRLIEAARTIRLTDADFARFKALGIKRLRKWLRTATPPTKEPT